ncbi:hypothetical protein N9068_00560 [bacterium]|nr:hypothetical protein [bacterium]
MVYQWQSECRSKAIVCIIHKARTATDLEINDNDLFVDVIRSKSEAFIYLTEKQSGGLGVIEKIVHRLSTDPNRFHNGMRHVLSHCQRDQTTDYLRSVVDEIQNNQPLAQSFATVRSTNGFSGQERSKASLQQSLSSNGFDATRERFVSLMSNILKPGSSPQTDLLIRDINSSWHAAETQLRVGIDSRVYAYSALQNPKFSPQIASHFQQLNGQATPTPTQLYNATERFLLPVCPDSCPECLTAFNRYNEFGTPSRELANLWLGLQNQPIQISNPNDDWRSEVATKIVESGLVAIEFAASISNIVLHQLNELLASEVEVGILFHPISIQRVEKVGNKWVLTLQLKDLIHG